MQYEYQIVELDDFPITGKTLNVYGKDGWEFCQMLPAAHGKQAWEVIFKRPKEEKPDYSVTINAADIDKSTCTKEQPKECYCKDKGKTFTVTCPKHDA